MPTSRSLRAPVPRPRPHTPLRASGRGGGRILPSPGSQTSYPLRSTPIFAASRVLRPHRTQLPEGQGRPWRRDPHAQLKARAPTLGGGRLPGGYRSDNHPDPLPPATAHRRATRLPPAPVATRSGGGSGSGNCRKSITNRSLSVTIPVAGPGEIAPALDRPQVLGVAAAWLPRAELLHRVPLTPGEPGGSPGSVAAARETALPGMVRPPDLARPGT